MIMQKNIKEVNAVFIANDQCLLDAYVMFASAFNKKIDIYKNPGRFLNNITRYPKHTRIVLGYLYSDSDQTGIQIAEYLHELEFTHLYLSSSQISLQEQIPAYLTFIVKPHDVNMFDLIFEESECTPGLLH